MKLKRISEQEFNQIDGTQQIIAEKYARQFASLEFFCLDTRQQFTASRACSTL